MATMQQARGFNVETMRAMVANRLLTLEKLLSILVALFLATFGEPVALGAVRRTDGLVFFKASY